MVVVPNPGMPVVGEVFDFPRPLRMLVVDRQPLFAAAIGRLMGSAPLAAEVISSRSSDLGLEIARAGAIDLVLCELTAEPISGTDLAGLLADEKPPIPVILLGDLDDEKQLAAALPSSPAGVSHKAITLARFLPVVRTLRPARGASSPCEGARCRGLRTVMWRGIYPPPATRNSRTS